MYLERLRLLLPEVRSRIERACQGSGRSDASAVTLVAVTKGHPLEALYAARDAGLEVVGENRVQEAAEKWGATGDLGLSWHLIGHLQRNKVKSALQMFDLIHSVDSLRLAREIEKETAKVDRKATVLIEVNASGETTKYGFPVEEAFEAVQRTAELEHLRVAGLMSMAPFTTDEAVLRGVFRRTRELYERCGEEIRDFEPRHLSMGMTNDYEIAIEEGSNMVRLGTALFGERGR